MKIYIKIFILIHREVPHSDEEAVEVNVTKKKK